MLHHMLFSRLLAAASAVVLTVLSFLAPPQRIPDDDTVVRVGLCYGETGKSSITMHAAGGFTLGRAGADGWTALLAVENETVIVSRLQSRPITGEARYVNAAPAIEAAEREDGTVFCENGIYMVAKGLSPAASEAIFTVSDENGSLLFLYAGAEALTLSADAAIEFPADETLYSYRGRIECRPDGAQFSVINVVGLEDYVKGVLPWEIGTNESDETTKAFAVLTRTAPLSESKPAHLEDGFDVCTGTCCQIYRGLARTDERLERLADETAGQILTYEGHPAVVLYHTTSGGATCSLSEAWGGDDLPYLRSVDVGEPYTEAQDGVWTEYLTMRELTSRLRAYGGVFSALTGTVSDIRVTATDCYGSSFVTELTVTDNEGNTAVLRYSSPIRQALGLKSANFTLTPLNLYRPNGSVYHAGVRINGRGYGHGVGLSGTGAAYLSESLGYDYTRILAAYFPGTMLKTLA